jgi:hypothetical protein
MSKGWWFVILFIILDFYLINSLVQEQPLVMNLKSEFNSNLKHQMTVQQLNNETQMNTETFEDKSLEEYKINKITRYFEWDYNDQIYRMSMDLYPEVDEMFKERERTRDYDLFASDYYSKSFIKSTTEELKNYGIENNLEENQIPYFIISFVQNLPYTSDNVTTGFDEYPRFPYETLYDNGGDCEDTSILVSAMLKELGYDAVLLQFPNHMAVGVSCDPTSKQSYYVYENISYCYLETTGKDWDVGEVPDNVKGSKAEIIQLIERPALKINFTSMYEYNFKDVNVDVNVTVKNLGSKTAKDTTIHVALQTTNTSLVWDQTYSDSIEIEPEETYYFNVENLHSKTGQPFRIYVRAYGENTISDEAVTDWIRWEK